MTAGGFNYQYETAVLTFGCFWGMQDLIDPQKGRGDVEPSGATSAESTSSPLSEPSRHAEAVEIVYADRLPLAA